MKIIAISHKMPKWMSEGFAEYQKRLTKPWILELIEIPPKAYLNDSLPEKIKATEAEWLLARLKGTDYCIALDTQGKNLTTEQFSSHLQQWQEEGRPLIFLIGGREGLDGSVLKRADFIWSLSALTLPHQLVKVILAEQLYRAVSILEGHPYHR